MVQQGRDGRSGEVSGHGCVVRVEGEQVGTGFLIGPDLVVTCSHVVGGRDEVHLAFPLEPGQPERGSTVIFRGVVGPGEVSGLNDMAVLKLTEPIDIKPASLGSLAAMEVTEGELGVFGFPGGYDGGMSTRAIAQRGAQFDRHYQLRSCSGEFPLVEGFSGAAAFFESGLVAGMITDADVGKTGLARMLPVDRLCELWPQLRSLIPLGPLSAAAYQELFEILPDIRIEDPAAVYAEWIWSPNGSGVLPSLPSGAGTLAHIVEFLLTQTTMRRPADQLSKLEGFLRVCVSYAEVPVGLRLREWIGRCLNGRVPNPVGQRPSPDVGSASVVVQVKHSGVDRDIFQVTITTVHYPEGTPASEPVSGRVSRVDLQRLVVREVPRLVRHAGKNDVMIEFVLPQTLIAEPVDEWEVPDDPPEPLGWICPVVVRDWEQYTSAAVSVLRRWQSLAGRAVADALTWYGCPDMHSPNPKQFLAWLRTNDEMAAIALTSAAPSMVRSGVRVGLPVILWSRMTCVDDHEADTVDCSGGRFRSELAAELADAAMADIPKRIKTLRANAGVVPDQPHVGRQITLLWDDPDRRMRPEPLLGLAD
jgi:vWA-MoxR associated protein C-terminal domain/Trypsin-like peptidase domain